MNINLTHSIPVIWIIILCTLLLTSCATKEEKHLNYFDTIAKQLSKLKI